MLEKLDMLSANQDMAQVNLSYLSDIWSWEKKGQVTIDETVIQKGREISQKKRGMTQKSGETWP